jgi:hypothetical protein
VKDFFKKVLTSFIESLSPQGRENPSFCIVQQAKNFVG